MTQLTTNLSGPLLDLLHSGEVSVDGVEVGSWFSAAQIRDYRHALPGIPFFFHGGDLIARVGLIPGAVSSIAAYLDSTASPWLSVHLTLWLPGMVWLMLRHGWRIPLPDVERATRRLVRQVKQLERAIRVPMTLENVEPLPFDGYDFEVRPGRIAEVLERTGCGLTLDTGHACVSAALLGIDVRDYVKSLPLARVVQVHVSGPRMRAGRLADAHEPLRAADYELLEFLLARSEPQVVTLEYIREREALREQLHCLHAILESHDQTRVKPGDLGEPRTRSD